MRAQRLSFLLSLGAPLLAAGSFATFSACGGQSVDPGDGDAADATAASGSSGSAMVDPVNITLGHGTDEIVVDLTKLTTLEVKGLTAVKLEDVWAAGGLADEASVTFDFEGDDGFHPKSKPACKALVTPAQLAHGYITPDSTRVLIWEDTLGFSGCYFVKGVKKITGVDGTGT